MRISDWSSDVCSSDLQLRLADHRLVAEMHPVEIADGERRAARGWRNAIDVMDEQHCGGCRTQPRGASQTLPAQPAPPLRHPDGLHPARAGLHSPCMIVIFTDFGPAGPYVGQMRARVAALAPGADRRST